MLPALLCCSVAAFTGGRHGRYHVFVQWSALSPNNSFPASWYHMSAPNLAGPWDRYPLQFANLTHAEVAGCSGGATIAPDGTPTLVICGGTTAVPVNRSDPLLTHWVQIGGDLTEMGTPPAYFPANIPGKWDCSVYKEPSGRYRVTFGSCTMLAGRTRPHQLNGYCDGPKQDGLPQVLSYVSDDFKNWQYLGEQWKGELSGLSPCLTVKWRCRLGHRWPPQPFKPRLPVFTLCPVHVVPVAVCGSRRPLLRTLVSPRVDATAPLSCDRACPCACATGDNGTAAGRRWGPRVECPYQFNIREHTLLKISAVSFSKDVLFVGRQLGNGSQFEPDPGGPPDGIYMDFGNVCTGPGVVSS